MNNSRIAWLVIVCLGLASITFAAGENFPEDVAAAEISLSDMLPLVPSHDAAAFAFGDGSGTVLAVMAEDYELHYRRSTDGGRTFGSELVAAGGTGDPAVLQGDSAVSPDGTVYFALQVADPQGDVGLQILSTDDLGISWTGPSTLIQRGDPTHGVFAVHIAAGSGGRVAIAYVNRWDRHFYVQASDDGGTSWTAPVQVDPGAAGLALRLHFEAPSLAIDGNGVIHVAYDQDRTGVGVKAFYTRSTDGGQSFEPERRLGPCSAPFPASGAAPALHVAADGSLLVGLYDSGLVAVGRSVDGGQSFGCSYESPFAPGEDGELTQPLFMSAPGSSTVMLALVEGNGWLTVHRSTDDGASFVQGPRLVETAVVPSLDDPVDVTGDATSEGVTDAPILARTPAGTWVVGWTDEREVSEELDLAVPGLDVYLRSSSDDGVTWGTAVRVDSGPDGSAYSVLGGLVPAAHDEVFVSFLDGRDDADRAANVYRNRGPAGSLQLDGDGRIDADRGLANGQCFEDTAVATDGGRHVYVAFACFERGDRIEVYVAASSDGGRSFAPPQRVSRPPSVGAAAGRVNGVPSIAATGDGGVFVTYLSLTATGLEGRINRSLDRGATWLDEDVLLDPSADLSGLAVLAASPGGKVFVAWASRVNVFLARSTDGAATFTIDRVEQNATSVEPWVAICSAGRRFALLYIAESSKALARVSDDGGATLGDSVQISGAVSDAVGGQPRLACGPGGRVAASWAGASGFEFGVFASAYDGVSWSPETVIPETGGAVGFAGHRLGFTSATNVVAVSASDRMHQVFANLSTDGGASYGPAVRLDEASPRPSSLVGSPALTADGSGNLWIAWEDVSAGAGSLVVRESNDAGVSFGVPRRVNRELPQGSRENSAGLVLRPPGIAALQGSAFLAWGGQRDSYLPDLLVNRTGDVTRTCVDRDEDGYGFPGDPACPAGPEPDCDDESGRVNPGALEVCDTVDNDCDGGIDEGGVCARWRLAGTNSRDLVYHTADFASWTRIPGQLTNLFSGDFDGDSRIDLAGLNAQGQVYYTTDLSMWVRIPGTLSSLVRGDFDDDGSDDLAGLNAQGRIYYTTNRSTWTRIPGTLSSLVRGDFDGNGSDDLAGLNAQGHVYYTTDLSGWVRIPGTLSSLVGGDFDGDGFDDLAGLNAQGRIYYTTDLATWTRIPGTLSSLVGGDFDGNGSDDLAGLNASGQIYHTTDLGTWTRIPGILASLVSGNLNDDGADDLAGLNAQGRIFYTLELIAWTRVPGTLNTLVARPRRGPAPQGDSRSQPVDVEAVVDLERADNREEEFGQRERHSRQHERRRHDDRRAPDRGRLAAVRVDVPPAGLTHWYLVTTENGLGEVSPGTRTHGPPRPASAPCP